MPSPSHFRFRFVQKSQLLRSLRPTGATPAEVEAPSLDTGIIWWGVHWGDIEQWADGEPLASKRSLDSLCCSLGVPREAALLPFTGNLGPFMKKPPLVFLSILLAGDASPSHSSNRCDRWPRGRVVKWKLTERLEGISYRENQFRA